MPKVLLFTTLADENVAELISPAPDDFDIIVRPTDLPDSEKAALVADADFVILFPAVLASDVIRAGKKLRLIQLVSAGFDKMDVAVCAEMGIPVANNGGANSIDVAEHAVMLMLASYRRLVEMDAQVRAGNWRAIDSGLTTFALHGKTVGLVGLGNIGRRVAQLLQPFGVTILYADAYQAPAEVEEQLRVQRVTLNELLQNADVVSLHVPLNDVTRGLISKREFEQMKSTAILINTCRGPVVDEDALAEALQNWHIAGAGLDVFASEPPEADSPLLGMNNVVLTPHSAGVTHDTWARRGEFIFENLQRVWDGEDALAVIA